MGFVERWKSAEQIPELELYGPQVALPGDDATFIPFTSHIEERIWGRVSSDMQSFAFGILYVTLGTPRPQVERAASLDLGWGEGLLGSWNRFRVDGCDAGKDEDWERYPHHVGGAWMGTTNVVPVEEKEVGEKDHDGRSAYERMGKGREFRNQEARNVLVFIEGTAGRGKSSQI